MTLTRGEYQLWAALPDSNQVIKCLPIYDDKDRKGLTVGKRPVYILGGNFWKRWTGIRAGRSVSKLWVSNQGDNTISVINEDSMKVVSTIPVGSAPEGLALSPDDSLLAVVNTESDDVTLIRTSTFQPVGTYRLGKTPRRAAFAMNEPYLFVSLFGEDSVAVLNYQSGIIVKKIPVGRNPVDVLVTPGGHALYVANQGTKEKPDNRVTKIKLPNLKLIRYFVCGRGCYGFARYRSGDLVVTNTFDNTATIIWPKGETGTFKVGKRPTGVSF